MTNAPCPPSPAPPPRRRFRPRPRGFALLVVLAALMPIALLAVYIAASGQSDLRVAAALRGSAQAEAVADGIVYEAAFRLLDPAAPWPANGRAMMVRRLGARVTLCIVNEAGKINPNIANPGLMAALFHAVGVDTEQSDRLGAAVDAWRFAGRGGAPGLVPPPANAASGPPPEPRQFADVRELALVPGITPGLVRRLQPYLTVLTDDQPDPRAASPVVLATLEALLGLDPATLTEPGRPRTVVIVAEAVVQTGERFVRRAGVRLGSAGEPMMRVLSWGQADQAACQAEPPRLAT